MESFEEVYFLETIISSYLPEVFPSTSLNETSDEIEDETVRNLYLDMRDTQLRFKLQ